MIEMDMSPFIAQLRAINSGLVDPLAAVLDCCPNAHPYTESNTIITAPGQRRCRACRADRQRRYRAKRGTT